MAEFEFEGLAAVGVGEDLIAEADPEHRQLGNQRADFLVDVAKRRRIAGTVREEQAIRLFRQHFGGGGAGVHDLHVEAGLPQAAEDVEFQPEIVGHDAVADRR